jgi:hypothetical protein
MQNLFIRALVEGRKSGLEFHYINLSNYISTEIYGCEICGMGNNDILERVHLKFCKLLFNLKTSTPSYMIYGELERYPIEIDVKVRIILTL